MKEGKFKSNVKSNPPDHTQGSPPPMNVPAVNLKEQLQAFWQHLADHTPKAFKRWLEAKGFTYHPTENKVVNYIPNKEYYDSRTYYPIEVFEKETGLYGFFDKRGIMCWVEPELDDDNKWVFYPMIKQIQDGDQVHVFGYDLDDPECDTRDEARLAVLTRAFEILEEQL